MTFVIKCPNCKRVNEPVFIGENHIRDKMFCEYKCVCGCHWVNRYGFLRRDILNIGDEKQRVGEHLD